jgi:hypothetical protein
MKLKPVTMVLLVTALLLGGVVYLTQTQEALQPNQTANAEQQPLFDFEEGDVQALTVETQTRSLQFERDDQGNWQMLQPEQAPANEASIAYLLNLLATGESDRTLTASSEDLAEYGLDEPLATIEVTLPDDETHRLVLGGYDFNRSFMYAQVDPPAEATEAIDVKLVSTDFNSAVRRPNDEWQQEEAEASPSPTSEASPSGTPTPESSPSPSPSASPSPSPSPSAE